MCLEMREVGRNNDISRISHGMDPNKIFQLGDLAEIGIGIRYEINVVFHDVPSQITIEILLLINDFVTESKLKGNLTKYTSEPCTGTFVMAKISIDLLSSFSHFISR
jgi:hypothetical protein